MSQSRIRAVLFDVDGTLANTLPMILAGLGDTYETLLGYRLPDSDIQSLVGTPLKDQLLLYGLDKMAEPTLDERIAMTLANYRSNWNKATLFDSAVEAFNQFCIAGYPTALVTSRNTEEVGDLLELFPVFGQADTIVCCDDVPNPKPAGDAAFLACERLGASPKDSIFIGDSIHDMACANNAGLTAIAVSYGAATSESLEKHSPKEIFNTPEQLLQWTHEFLEQKS